MESLLRLTLSRKGFCMLQTVFTVLDHNEQIKKSAVISVFWTTPEASASHSQHPLFSSDSVPAQHLTAPEIPPNLMLASLPITTRRQASEG